MLPAPLARTSVDPFFTYLFDQLLTSFFVQFSLMPTANRAVTIQEYRTVTIQGDRAMTVQEYRAVTIQE